LTGIAGQCIFIGIEIYNFLKQKNFFDEERLYEKKFN